MDARGEALPAAVALSDREIDEAFRQNYARIARVIGRVVGDRARAEELAVDAFLRWWRRTGARGEGASKWLYRVAIRMAIDELRRDALTLARDERTQLLRARPRGRRARRHRPRTGRFRRRTARGNHASQRQEQRFTHVPQVWRADEKRHV